MFFIMDNDKKLFNALQWAIEDMDMKQTDIGSVLGLKQPAVSLLLSGKRKTRPIHIKKMAIYMGISSEELMKRSKLWDASVNEERISLGMDIEAVSESDITTAQHKKIIDMFNDKKTAMEINKELVKLEKLDANQLNDILSLIKDRNCRLEQEAEKKRTSNGED